MRVYARYDLPKEGDEENTRRKLNERVGVFTPAFEIPIAGMYLWKWFIELNNGSLVNIFWLDDIYQDMHDKTRVVYVYVNGAKKVEIFDNEQNAESRVTEIKQQILNI